MLARLVFGRLDVVEAEPTEVFGVVALAQIGLLEKNALHPHSGVRAILNIRGKLHVTRGLKEQQERGRKGWHCHDHYP